LSTVNLVFAVSAVQPVACGLSGSELVADLGPVGDTFLSCLSGSEYTRVHVGRRRQFLSCLSGSEFNQIAQKGMQ